MDDGAGLLHDYTSKNLNLTFSVTNFACHYVLLL